MMTDYLLWQSSLRGPVPVILHDHKELNKHERKTKLCDPIKISATGDLSTLAKLYPLPIAVTNEIDSVIKK